jgi:hypothetical protein
MTGRTLQRDPGRDRDHARRQAGPGDPAGDHGNGLPGRHPDRLEHAQVMHLFPGVQDDGVEYAEPGHQRQQQRQGTDQAEHQRDDH